MELAIAPTRLSLSVRITSLMKCEFTLRSRSETERRKFMCKRLGASSRMCWKVGSSTVPRSVGSAAVAMAERGSPSSSAISPKKFPDWINPSVSC